MSGPIYSDRVAEWTATVGITRPYILGGAIPENTTFNSRITTGDWVYAEVFDSVRREIIKARFTSPNLLLPLEYISTTNANSAVNWPVGIRPIIRLIPTPVNYLLEDIFWMGIELGGAIDLGDLGDQSISIIDMGELIVGMSDDLIYSIEMGERS